MIPRDVTSSPEGSKCFIFKSLKAKQKYRCFFVTRVVLFQLCRPDDSVFHPVAFFLFVDHGLIVVQQTQVGGQETK